MTPCPACNGKGTIDNAQFERRDPFARHRFEDGIMQYIRSNHLFKRESCLLCVEKHVGAAREYYREMLKAAGSGNSSGDAKISVELNHLSVIGQLTLAMEEAEDYTELFDLLKATERIYRYEHIEPNWSEIALKIIAVKESQ